MTVDCLPPKKAAGARTRDRHGLARSLFVARAVAVMAEAILTANCTPLANRPADRASIGAVLAQRHADGRVWVRSTPRGLAAARGGLEADDEVLLVDGRDVRSMSPQDLHLALEGAPGTTVRLTVFRRGRVERLLIDRENLPKGN